jgi:hypothetical protein
MKVNVYHNGDDVFIAWKPNGFIKDCRGFALLRRRNGVEEVVSTWVGFVGQAHEDGERRASTNWPVQKYQWTDYMAAPGDKLQYRVFPMVGPSKDNLVQDHTNASEWTKEIELTYESDPKICVYFNRGIVASQWVSRRLGITADDLKSKLLETIIDTPGHPMRNFLFGPLGERLFELLDEAATKKREVYAALYELHDKQLESALVKIGSRAHVVLANGSVKAKGLDQNKEARAHLVGKVDLHDRMISPNALGHNKFLVICDSKKNPRWVWTGSQNWTRTGLCTQANNSVLIDDRRIANEFKKQWDLLKAASDKTPKTQDREHDASQPRAWQLKGPHMVHPDCRSGGSQPGEGAYTRCKERDPIPNVQPGSQRHAAEPDHRHRAQGKEWRQAVHSRRDQSGPEHKEEQCRIVRQSKLGQG